jgi:hypothetical protein
MSLSDKLSKVATPSEVVSIHGIRFRCCGKSLLDGGEISAKAAKRKTKRVGFMDACWLEACVEDADDGSKLSADDWMKQPRSVTGPLVSVVMRLNGLDDQDLERDPKDSSTTETGS